jgi:TonB family protein
VHKPKKRKVKKRSIKKPKSKKQPKRVKSKTRKHLLSAKDIKISKKVIKNDSEPVVPVKISSNSIEKSLTNSYRKNRIKTSYTHKPTNSVAGNVSQNYFEQVSALMYQTWQQPNHSELRGKNPVVNIEITVDAYGRVLKSRIVQRSGVVAMDRSADKLLREIRKLPKPPTGKTTFTVSLEIIK